MNKDKIEVGDLVTQPYRRREIGIGLVIDDDGSYQQGVATLRYKIYWFKSAQIVRGSRGGLTKIKAPKNPNEPSKAHNGSHQL